MSTASRGAGCSPPRRGPGCPGSTSRTGSSRRRRPRSTSWSRAGTTDLRSRGQHDGRRVATGHGRHPQFGVPVAAPACSASSPAPPATSAAGWCPSCSRPGTGCACMARHPERLRDQPWAGRGRGRAGDAPTPATLRGRCDGVDVAYYLIHALGTGAASRRPTGGRPRTLRAPPREAAGVRPAGLPRRARARRPPSELSPHLRSRAEVGRDPAGLAACPTAVLRAAVIIGSGSASFEMLRYLTERLPVMVTPTLGAHPDPADRRPRRAALPRRLRRRCRREVNRGFDIGGPGRPDVPRDDAAVRGRSAGLPRRLHLPVPVLTPALSEPLGRPGHAGAELASRGRWSSRCEHEVVCREHDIAELRARPARGAVGFDRRRRLALQRIRDADVATRWSSASVPGRAERPAAHRPRLGRRQPVRRRRARRRWTPPPDALWRVDRGHRRGARLVLLPAGLGGSAACSTGSSAASACAAAGATRDRLRRRRDRWTSGGSRSVEPGRLLRLRAEMRLPGLAWLELGVGHEDGATPDGGTLYVQRALFHPRGLLGHLYWWSVAPFHGIVFGGMARNIAARRRTARRRRVTRPYGAPDDQRQLRADGAHPVAAPRPGRRSAADSRAPSRSSSGSSHGSCT